MYFSKSSSDHILPTGLASSCCCPSNMWQLLQVTSLNLWFGPVPPHPRVLFLSVSSLVAGRCTGSCLIAHPVTFFWVLFKIAKFGQPTEVCCYVSCDRLSTSWVEPKSLYSVLARAIASSFVGCWSDQRGRRPHWLRKNVLAVQPRVYERRCMRRVTWLPVSVTSLEFAHWPIRWCNLSRKSPTRGTVDRPTLGLVSVQIPSLWQVTLSLYHNTTTWQ